jgi:hypothetical protein
MYSSAPQGTVITRKGGVPWLSSRTAIHFPFERISKRRKGFPSETQVKRGQRVVGGDKYLVEKLGRNDPCPCGSGRRFQEMLFTSIAVRGLCAGRLLLDRVAIAPNQREQPPSNASVTSLARASGVAGAGRGCVRLLLQ